MELKFKPTNITLGVFVTIIQLFLYVNAGAIFPHQYVQQAQNIILLYMVMTFGASILYMYVPSIKAPMIPKETQQPFWMELIWFFVSFFTFALVLKAMPLNMIGSEHIFAISNVVRVAIPFLVLFSFVVAYTEELIFRGILPKLITDVGSNVLFGIFHFYAYSGNLLSILVAIIFGFIFSFTRDKLGLMGSVGMHTAWNLRILGAF